MLLLVWDEPLTIVYYIVPNPPLNPHEMILLGGSIYPTWCSCIEMDFKIYHGNIEKKLWTLQIPHQCSCIYLARTYSHESIFNLCLTLFPSAVGWYIMGYVSETLPSHRWISNQSYTLNVKNFTFISWSIYLPYHVIIPPPNMSVRSMSLCCHHVYFSFVPVWSLRHNGGLYWLDILGA